MDKGFAEKIIEYVGGIDNIESVYHCVTRIRFLIRDNSRVRCNDLKQLPNVLDAIYTNGQLMIVLDTDLLTVYECVNKSLSQKENWNREDISAKAPILNRIYNSVSKYILATINPFIDIMIVVGILKIILILLCCIFRKFDNTFLYVILNGLFWIVYLMIPILISYNGARALGIKPVCTIIVSTVICIDLYLKGAIVNNVIISLSRFKYDWFCSSLFLSSLLIAPTLFLVERSIRRYLPRINNNIAISLLSIICSILIDYVLFPYGVILNDFVVNIVLLLNNICGPLLTAIVTALLPFVIIRGLHASVGPLLITILIVSNGYDPLVRVAFLIHNIAEGGAVLGYFLKRNIDMEYDKCFEIIKKCLINGISEPALLKVNIRRKETIVGVMVGGALASFLANYWNVKAYFWGEATSLSLPIFLDTIGYMFFAMVIAFLTSAVTTYFLISCTTRTQL